MQQTCDKVAIARGVKHSIYSIIICQANSFGEPSPKYQAIL